MIIENSDMPFVLGTIDGSVGKRGVQPSSGKQILPKFGQFAWEYKSGGEWAVALAFHCFWAQLRRPSWNLR